MTSGTRLPTWKERENNKRRERRRRAIAAKIFAGLRMYGNYKLPKHCDNNEVLKALCKEAGWIVEEDGTTYRKGCKHTERMDIMGSSVSVSPCSSYQPSPVSSRYITNNNNDTDPNSLIPWLKNLSSGSSPSSSKLPHHLYIPGGSISAPVTPPLSSPTARTPRMNDNWDDPKDSGWLSGVQTPQDGPSSPTFSLVSPNPFGFKEPLSNALDRSADVPMSDAIQAEFAFGCNAKGIVKPWEGERIHEECITDDLELTLGNSNTR
nr:BES1/BZR1 homolog protein 4-like isoform X1 [Ipomoea batatas]